MWDAPPHKKNRIVDFAGLRLAGSDSDPNAAFPNGRPKQAVADAVMKERLLNAAENSGLLMGVGFHISAILKIRLHPK